MISADERARAEADKRYGVFTDDGDIFVAAAAWQREQDPTDEMIEAAARALYAEDANESMSFDHWPEYDSPENADRQVYEEHARAALLAAAQVMAER